MATIIGIIVLAQIPSWIEIAGVTLVIGGVALHRPGGESSASAPVTGAGAATQAP